MLPQQRSARGRAWQIGAATAATALVIGIALGQWLLETPAPVSAVAADARPRAPIGEARLLMDQGFEQFGKRVGAHERAKAPRSAPARRGVSATTRPAAAADASPSEEG
jgi:hypothetical protein